MLRLEATDGATDPPGPPRSYLFDRGPVCIGRSLRQNHISLRGYKISRLHAVIDQTTDGWWILHRGRLIETTVNGKPLAAETPTRLSDNDVIGIEGHQIGVRIDLESAEAPTEMVVSSEDVTLAVRKIVEASQRAAPPRAPVAPAPAPAAVRAAAPPAPPSRAPAPPDVTVGLGPAGPGTHGDRDDHTDEIFPDELRIAKSAGGRSSGA